ncbi:hypothetical protein LSTR_LSTR007592 [Laodelphax striatellus]|uniref:Uncharacterized protein n=1 Tax=Laodelphax striatellus TaxID=195883 RepID=A0A482WIM6_LAOST|nr:hypothetical protein LSTR_LSTR007592 [Laodelphax striatellus]
MEDAVTNETTAQHALLFPLKASCACFLRAEKDEGELHRGEDGVDGEAVQRRMRDAPMGGKRGRGGVGGVGVGGGGGGQRRRRSSLTDLEDLQKKRAGQQSGHLIQEERGSGNCHYGSIGDLMNRINTAKSNDSLHQYGGHFNQHGGHFNQFGGHLNQHGGHFNQHGIHGNQYGGRFVMPLLSYQRTQKLSLLIQRQIRPSAFLIVRARHHRVFGLALAGQGKGPDCSNLAGL